MSAVDPGGLSLRSIVVLDEDLDRLDLIAAYFKPRGFVVRSFSDPEVAIAESLRSGGDWDALLTDLQFSKMASVDFLARLKRILPRLPLIKILESDALDSVDGAVGGCGFSRLHAELVAAIGKAAATEVPPVAQTGYPGIVGRSSGFLEALDIARRVAKSSASILISGESGTGKEVFARFVHDESHHSQGPFIAINCSAIPESLLESELFGHAKGSFTGAQSMRVGLFEEAQDGTLFLDEIGDLSLPLQAKLLRVLQEKMIRRVGENQYRSINCRIISATHKDLSSEVRGSRFREDLFFRLDVVPILIPPLRDRREDILPLAEFFLKKFSRESGLPLKRLSKDAEQYLLERPWRGNVRELENTVERSVALCGGPEISVADFMLPLSSINRPDAPSSAVPADGIGFSDTEGQRSFSIRFSKHLPLLDDVIQKYIEFAVGLKGGARDKTAKEIGIDRKTLYKWMRGHIGAVD